MTGPTFSTAALSGALALACCFGLTAPARAQASAAVVAAPANPPAARVPDERTWKTAPTQPGDETLFRLFGVPVDANAPVGAPYAGSAYRDRGGQPESSADAAEQGNGSAR